MKKVVLSILLAICSLSACYGADLMDIYEQALENDPTFKKAYSTYLSSAESIPQAYAALRPQASLNASKGLTNMNVIGVGDSLNTTYDSTIWQINASQALFNYQAWSQVQLAKASVKASQAIFNDAAQDLMLRSAKAYFSVLLAGDTLSFAEAKKRANKRQLEQARQRFLVGLDPITSVYEAKAGYDQSISQVIAASNDLVNQNENLRKLTNHVYDSLAPLRNSQIPLIKPEPANVNEWIDLGLKQNYKLYAAKYRLQSSRDNIKAQASANWPTLAVQGSTVQTNNNVTSSSFFLPDKQTVSNVSLALNFPVFQGGLVLSKTRQAQYDYQSSSEDLETVYRDVVVNSRIAFNTIIDGISKVKADRETVVSQANALESTDAQFEVGTRTMVDIVNAQRRLFEAQTQLASSQYNLIKAILNLKYLAGTLNVQDLEEIDAWLKTTRISGFPPSK
ncbi:MAG: hypothetical protein A3F46_02745 [Legionellales bacterium RIFCSPHIGHO2_12_FULL_42_9]|nr:MAG: hypothetical protein A3F46_02745 [Legionellales bacterium RIFCSPHIGHO2_12_FULL_42_9]